jgi:AcrR family transcriptional regulator
VFIVTAISSRSRAHTPARAIADGSPPPSHGTEERLLRAVTLLAGRDGYPRLSVERILELAAVSRATFYQYFSNVDDCFWSAYRRHAERLVADVAAATAAGKSPEFEALDALVALAVSQPHTARMLMREGLTAGPAGPAERDALIARVADAIRASQPAPSTVDLPPQILVGAVFGFLAMRVSDGGALAGLREYVLEWALAFLRCASLPSWSARLAPAFPPQVGRSPARASAPPAGATRRERVLRATAAAVCAKGYRDTTVTDIVALAGVSRRSFYNEFQSKADAFVAAYEHGFQLTLMACTPAFFISASWPERVWASAQAFTGFLSREPIFAHLGFLECYALGPDFTQRAYEIQLAFTLFLEEGYRQRPQARPLSRACADLTAAAIFELAFQGTRRGPSMYLRSLQPLAVYIALAPFIGVDDAGEFVTDKLSTRTGSAAHAICSPGRSRAR